MAQSASKYIQIANTQEMAWPNGCQLEQTFAGQVGLVVGLFNTSGQQCKCRIKFVKPSFHRLNFFGLIYFSGLPWHWLPLQQPLLAKWTNWAVALTLRGLCHLILWLKMIAPAISGQVRGPWCGNCDVKCSKCGLNIDAYRWAVMNTMDSWN